MCINFYKICVKVYSPECIATGYVVQIKIEYIKATTIPLKIYLEYPVTRMVGKNNSLWKEAMRTITSKKGSLNQLLGNRTRNENIQQRVLLSPATAEFCMREETG